MSLSQKLPSLKIYRDDLIHPTVSGNKLHKLKPNIALAKELKCPSILSFGGPYSNHLHALAWVCKEQGINCFGLVRGELHKELTPTLHDCQDWGMNLISMPRRTYRALQEKIYKASTPCFKHDILPSAYRQIPKNTLVIAEGGSNMIAINSISDAYTGVFKDPNYDDITHAVCATGTGATVAGLAKAAPSGIKVIGVQAVAESRATIERIESWLGEKPTNLSITEGHLGGFAKTTPELLRFIAEFEAEHNIPLDPVYNGKVLYKLSEMFRDGQFAANDTVLVVHTGGLQGKRSLG